MTLFLILIANTLWATDYSCQGTETVECHYGDSSVAAFPTVCGTQARPLVITQGALNRREGHGRVTMNCQSGDHRIRCIEKPIGGRDETRNVCEVVVRAVNATNEGRPRVVIETTPTTP